MRKIIFNIFAIVVLMNNCVSNEAQCKIEKIQAPVNLSYTAVGTSGFSEISFWAENTEDGFDGFSIFIASSATVAKTKALDGNNVANQKEDYFCKFVCTSECYKNTLTIQLGGSAIPNMTCENSSGVQFTSVPSGQYVALRARALRTTIPTACGEVDNYSPASVIPIP